MPVGVGFAGVDGIGTAAAVGECHEHVAAWSGLTATHSGRSSFVAPTASAACRVRSRTSAWSAHPLAVVSGPWPWTSGTHEPRSPSSKRATWRTPWSSGDWPRARTAGQGCDADELVEVLAVRVVTGVDDDPAAPPLDHGGVLVLDATERRPLDRHRLRVGRVDLDHPAEPVRLLAVGGQVEAPAGGVPR